MKDTSVALLGTHLDGRRICLCVTGGIASIETPKLVRMLRRYGAIVSVVLSQDALQFITPQSLQWASGYPVVTQLSGSAEHLDDTDMILVAPATLNTISKCALGIADTVVTARLAGTLATTPIVFCPTMHESMWQNPLLQQHIGELEQLGVTIISPRFGEGKAKMPYLDTICYAVIRRFSTSLTGKRVLVTAGPTRGSIDDVRFITNRSSGTLGVLIAQELWLRGADVTLIYGPGKAVPPPFLNVIPVETAGEMLHKTLEALETKHDAAIFTAAVLDFAPADAVKGKLPTKELTVTLVPTPKIIREVHCRHPALPLVGFKLEAGMTIDALLEKAWKEMDAQGSCLLVANRLEDIGDGFHRAFILDHSGILHRPQTKGELSYCLVKEIARLGGKNHA